MASVVNMNDVVFENIIKLEGYNTSTGELMWLASQLTDGTLSVTSETEDVTDAKGAVIARFYRSINAEFTATNALFNLSLAAAQTGNSEGIIRGGTNSPIVVPKSETFTVAGTTITLSEVPVGTTGAEIPYIYACNGAGNLTTSYKLAATVSATEFALDAATKRITLPTSIATGDKIMVNYNCETENAVMFKANGNDTPRACRALLYVKCHNVCDPSAIVYGILEFPNAQLSPDYDLNFTSDGGHELTLQMMQDFCDGEKRLYNFYLIG